MDCRVPNEPVKHQPTRLSWLVPALVSLLVVLDVSILVGFMPGTATLELLPAQHSVEHALVLAPPFFYSW